MRLTLHPNAAYTGHSSYQHHKGAEDGPKPGHREPTREGTMPEVLGDRPRPQRTRDIRAKTSEGDRREIERSRRGSKGIEGPRRSSRLVEGASEVFGISVWVRTSLARVVEVGDGSGSADGGPEALSNSVGMTGHVVPLQTSPNLYGLVLASGSPFPPSHHFKLPERQFELISTPRI